METCKQIFVSGLVQGVFYRDSTRRQADALGLTGGVRNLFDGRVEVIVCGDDVLVQQLIKWLEIGPKHANVSIIEVITLSEKTKHDNHFQLQAFNGFSIWSNR